MEEGPNGLELTEIKSSQTANREYAKNITSFVSSLPETIKSKSKRVVYDGNEGPVFSGVRYINWKSLSE